MPRQVAIVGVGGSPIARHGDRSITDLAIEAATAAIADAGLTVADIDGYVGSPGAPNPSATHADGLDEISCRFMAAALGLRDPRWYSDVEGMATAMVVAATQALIAGTCRYVVGVRALYNPRDRRYSESRADVAAGPEQFSIPYGLGAAGGRFAIWLQRYMHDHGATRDELYEIARIARDNAQRNPLAVWRGTKPLEREQYRDARWIYEPMCLYDADMPVTGAAAFVMTTAERARDLPHAAYVVSYGVNSGERVFAQAGIAPADVQVAQLYDGFSLMVWNWLEKLGFCGTGEAHAFTQGGRIAHGGALPLNTFGGALGEGRLHGMGHVREAALQAMGRAGERQVPNVHYSLVLVGVPERAWSVVLTPDP